MQTLPTVMNIPLVDLKAQYDTIKNEIDRAIEQVIAQTAFIGGPFVKEFEDAFAAHCGVKHCIGVANGTDALFIAMRALGIGAGDEVITAANSFIATSEAIAMAGAKVVFVDIDPRTYTIDAARIEEKITPRTKAFIPVHLYGQPADMDRIRSIAAAHKLAVIGDAAQAHGARYKGQPIAALAEISCFSFYPGKNLGAYGDAGALVTDDDQLAAKARMFANHGRTRKYDHDFEGVNSRLDGLQAAILRVKVRHLDQWTEARRRVASLYNEALRGTSVVLPEEAPGRTGVYHLYVVRVPNGKRDQLLEHLKQHGIGAGIHYPIALPFLNAYKHLGHGPQDFPESRQASEQILSLPIFPEMTEEHVRYIAAVVASFRG
jgi:dTDP-4-amino-4,6-dideoxygalactose transaminase